VPVTALMDGKRVVAAILHNDVGVKDASAFRNPQHTDPDTQSPNVILRPLVSNGDNIARVLVPGP